MVGDLLCGAVPGYKGYIPGSLPEGVYTGAKFTRAVERGREAHSVRTFNGQALREAREDQDLLARTAVPPPQQPYFDNRGIIYPAAGDTRHSRIPLSGEERLPFHSTLNLTSKTYDNVGDAGRARGCGSALRSIAGFTGYIPGKDAEGIYGATWSKTTEKSLDAHFMARLRAPKKFSLLNTEGVIMAPVSSDATKEAPIVNRSFQDHARGWSDCAYTGKQVDPAGRQPPFGRQEGFGLTQAPIFAATKHIPRYQGFVPGKTEGVVGMRQTAADQHAVHLFKRATMRNTQR